MCPDVSLTLVAHTELHIQSVTVVFSYLGYEYTEQAKIMTVTGRDTLYIVALRLTKS